MAFNLVTPELTKKAQTYHLPFTRQLATITQSGKTTQRKSVNKGSKEKVSVTNTGPRKIQFRTSTWKSIVYKCHWMSTREDKSWDPS
ncbi:hypothetical protein M378DRAFT_162400 [Amanita muscaria Koide BX008]|uniref:Uncharacterized protein n=1 Tax=Amanita muscaria (strain Koide BX008) TaxID=946122 RepID=A0A0C2SPI4_AMAMK|nr:hypothetical protein M378DRAFT_162400 [Amanita muscaria Koide BX008]